MSRPPIDYETPVPRRRLHPLHRAWNGALGLFYSLVGGAMGGGALVRVVREGVQEARDVLLLIAIPLGAWLFAFGFVTIRSAILGRPGPED